MTSEERALQREKYGKHYIGNVIRIINERTIIVNVGKDVLSVGDTIQIYEVGDVILDIDGTNLENFEYIKDKLEVTQVNDNYSICTKMEAKIVNTLKTLSPEFMFSKKEYLPLNVKEEDIEPFPDFESTIKIGDPIKLY